MAYSNSCSSARALTGVYVVNTSKSYSSDNENKFYVDPVETFCKIDIGEKLNCDPFWPYSVWKETQEYDP